MYAAENGHHQVVTALIYARGNVHDQNAVSSYIIFIEMIHHFYVHSPRYKWQYKFST
jgi:hypothetical protein